MAAKRVAFDRELAMYEPIAAVTDELAEGLAGAGEGHVMFEIPSVRGIPDVLWVAFDTAELERRTRHALSPVLESTHVRVLTALATGAQTLPQVAQAAGVGGPHLRRSVLPLLIDAGWLEPLTGRGATTVVAPVVQYRPLVRSLVTVEAKRRDWRGALSQAYRHQGSADRVFIAIDAATPGQLLRLADELALHGVGLITVDAATASATRVSVPADRPVVVTDRAVLAERAWSLLLAGRTSWDTFEVFGRDLTSDM